MLCRHTTGEFRMNTLYTQSIRALMSDAEHDERAKEILDIVLKDSYKPEYLGGNGEPDWHHVKGHDAGHVIEQEDGDVDYIEHLLLTYSVREHQTSLETNGAYNVRQLARWKFGYSAEKAREAVEKRHKELLGIRPTDYRKLAMDATYEARKAKRLARLAARHG